MKYIYFGTIILLIVFCVLLINYMSMDKRQNFYTELVKQAEILNDRINRILYVKVLQEGDTLWFISDDLKDTSWIVNDSSWITEGDAELKWISWKWEPDNDLYLMGDVFVYPDQFSGNTYVINAEGDTIFKYIKGEKGGD